MDLGAYESDPPPPNQNFVATPLAFRYLYRGKKHSGMVAFKPQGPRKVLCKAVLPHAFVPIVSITFVQSTNVYVYVSCSCHLFFLLLGYCCLVSSCMSLKESDLATVLVTIDVPCGHQWAVTGARCIDKACRCRSYVPQDCKPCVVMYVVAPRRLDAATGPLIVSL